MSSNIMFNIRNINLRILIRDLLRELWIVILVGCIGAMVTYISIKDSYVPQYTSSSIYVVTPKQSSGYVYTNKTFAENVVNVFQNLMDTDIMKNRISKELHVNNLNAEMKVDLITETNLMTVTVTAEDPILAFNIVGAIMDNYSELSEYLTSDAVFEPLKEAVVATGPVNVLAPKKKSMNMGILYGIIVFLLLAVISILRKTVKTENAIEELFDANLLGTIFHEDKNRTVKAKIEKRVKSLLITSPIVSSQFIESINNIRIKLEYEHERRPEKNVYMITSVCENEGKSTVSLNVALSLAKAGNRVIILDADMRKPAIYKMLDIPKKNVVDYIKLLQGECGLDEILYRDKNLGLDLIMCTKGYAGTHEYMKSGAMRDLIEKCSRMADYVIVDTPPMALVADAEVLIDRTDFSLLIVRQDVSYESDINNCINNMNDANSKFLGCVLNDYKVFGTASERNTYSYEQSSGKAVEIYDR